MTNPYIYIATVILIVVCCSGILLAYSYGLLYYVCMVKHSH